MGITTTYSSWFILLCIATGAVYAVVLYFKNKREDFSKSIIIFLSLIRFFIVSLMCFFLLLPLINITTRNKEKPIIILAQDNSESVLINKDSMFYKEEYPRLIKSMILKLQDKFELKTYSFGDEVIDTLGFDYRENLTDMSGLFRYIASMGYNTQVAAMILATDGIYNTGLNPLYESNFINYPIYTIAMGDTNTPKDLLIEKINFNKLVFLNNSFIVEVVVNAFLCNDESTELELIYDGKKIATQGIEISNDGFIRSYTFSITAEKPGKKKLTAQLRGVDKELTLINNTFVAYIDVIDSRQKILMLSNAPHPDIGAIRAAIESNINYEVEYFLAGDFKGNINTYSMVILHNLPSQSYPVLNLIKQTESSLVPVLYIVGLQTDINSFNNQKNGLTINNTKSNVYNEILALLNPEFSLFVVSENTQRALLRMPPLYSYFGNYNSGLSSVIFLYQKIGQLNTRYPLFLFNEVMGRKIGIIAGEGFWRWRLMDYMENESHNATNEIINKTVQYLSIRADKSNFRLSHKDLFHENEAIVIDAEVYNESYELINTTDVYIVIKSDEKEYAYVFSKKDKSYTLNAGLLPIGEYTYDAQVRTGSTLLTKKGRFRVEDINKESLVSTADHKLLYQLSLKHKAKLYYPRETDELFEEINNNNDFKPVIYETKKITDLISLNWLMFLLIILLGIEWFIRKRRGSY